MPSGLGDRRGALRYFAVGPSVKRPSKRKEEAEEMHRLNESNLSALLLASNNPSLRQVATMPMTGSKLWGMIHCCRLLHASLLGGSIVHLSSFSSRNRARRPLPGIGSSKAHWEPLLPREGCKKHRHCGYRWPWDWGLWNCLNPRLLHHSPHMSHLCFFFCWTRASNCSGKMNNGSFNIRQRHARNHGSD